MVIDQGWFGVSTGGRIVPLPLSPLKGLSPGLAGMTGTPVSGRMALLVGGAVSFWAARMAS